MGQIKDIPDKYIPLLGEVAKTHERNADGPLAHDMTVGYASFQTLRIMLNLSRSEEVLPTMKEIAASNSPFAAEAALTVKFAEGKDSRPK